MSGQPDVSVIIIVHNDPHNLRNSVRSALQQTLRNLEVIIVDDCSDDDSFEVASSLAASDPRVRVLQTSKNSGGPGAPRNVGIRAAQAPWLTFLDSDDTLDRHACKNLLRAAERDNSDIVAGKTIRVHLETGRETGWHPRLYTEDRRLESISQFVELAIDSIAAAKLYRRQFLLQNSIFLPEGMHYEDLVFTAQAYRDAKGISIIPERVYNWKIYPTQVRKSITNQRDDDANLRHRLAALDRIDEIVGGASNAALRERLQLKFLRHDARIYLNDIPRMPRTRARATLDILHHRLHATPREVYRQLSDLERLLCGAALLRSPRGVVETLRAINGVTTLEGKTVQSGGKVIWLPTDIQDTVPAEHTLEHELLNITGRPLLDTPFPLIKFSHRAKTLRKRAGQFFVHGETSDPFGKLQSATDVLSGHVEVYIRGKSFTSTVPLQIQVLDRQRLAWNFELRIPREAPFERPLRFDFRIHLSTGQSKNASSVLFSFIRSPKRRILAPGVRGRVLRQRYALYKTQAGRFALRLVKAQGKRGSLESALLRASAWTRSAFTPQIKGPKPESMLGKSLYRGFRALPLDSRKAVFESHMGGSVQDSPRKIADSLSVQRPEIRHVWSVNSDSAATPKGAVKVRRHSLGYLWHLATAKYLTDNQSFPSYFIKRSNQVYLQTWHGIPLKKMGFDEPLIMASESNRQAMTRKVAQWDYLNVPSEYFQDVFVPAFGFTGKQICYGSPRNDELVNQSVNASDLAAKFDLPKNKKILLYAPTFRQNERGRKGPTPLRINLSQWAEEMGEEYYLLIRAHYLNRINIPFRLRPYCMDVSNHDNINDLYHVADAVITDYSSVMFDYACLDRPIFIYAYDYEKYITDERGTYFDLQMTPPGHFAFDQDELQSVIRTRWNDLESRSMLRAFRKLYCGVEPGNSAEQTVKQVWGAAGE